jgi:hypothetical protein
MKRSVGITASAVISILGSACAVAFGGLMFVTTVLSSLPSIPPTEAGQPPLVSSPRLMLGVMSGFYFAFAVWGIVSAIGLLRLRNWARISFVVFAVLLTLFSFGGAFASVMGLLVGPAVAPTENAPTVVINAVFIVLLAFSISFATLAIWWLIYFNRAAVKVQFTNGAQVPAGPSIPMSVRVISWILIVSGAALPFQFFFSYPFVIAGFVVRGAVAEVVLLVCAAVCLTAGIGMLRKRIEAHTLAVAYFGFGLLNALSMALPGLNAKTKEIMNETLSRTPFAAGTVEAYVWLGVAIGLIGALAALWFLLTRRKAFIAAVT